MIQDSAVFLLFSALIMFKLLTSGVLFLQEFYFSPPRRKAASEKPEDSQNVSDSSLFQYNIIFMAVMRAAGILVVCLMYHILYSLHSDANRLKDHCCEKRDVFFVHLGVMKA